ncbi:MAG: PKD domain-containing protein [Candidatus Thermoplasmatota archaeon]|nr:PKD domain-containing protein [Candidatus Thermoplasmatota archaeon]
MRKTKFVTLLLVTLMAFSVAFVHAGVSSKEPLRADAGNAQIVSVNETVNFFGSAIGGEEPYNYSWNFNRFYASLEDFSFGSDTTIDAYEQNVTWIYNLSGLYIVELIVEDNASIKKSDCTAVIVLSEYWATLYNNWAQQCEQFSANYSTWLSEYEDFWSDYEALLANYSSAITSYEYLVNLSGNWSQNYEELLEIILEIKQNCSALENLTVADYFEDGMWNLSAYNESYSKLYEFWELKVQFFKDKIETLRNCTFGALDWQEWKDNFTTICGCWINRTVELNFTVSNLLVEYQQNSSCYVNLESVYNNWNTNYGSWIEYIHSFMQGWGGFTKNWSTKYNWSKGLGSITSAYKNWQTHNQTLAQINVSELFENLESLNESIAEPNLSANYTQWLRDINNLTEELLDILAQNWSAYYKTWSEKYKVWEEYASALKEKFDEYYEKLKEHYQEIKNYTQRWTPENITKYKQNISLYIENFAGYANNWMSYFKNLTGYYGNLTPELNISMQLTILGEQINLEREFGFVLVAGYNNTSANVWITHEMGIRVKKQFSVDKKLELVVSGTAQDANKTLRIVLPAEAINVSRLEVLFDNQLLAQEYINWTVDNELLIILIKVPYFSEHTVTIQEAPRKISPAIPEYYTWLAIGMAIIIIVLAAVYLYNFKKKKAT